MNDEFMVYSKVKYIWNKADKKWLTSEDLWDDVDEEGYCTCEPCQRQRELEKLKIPDELFEMGE